jgi:hypothetical protein
MALNYKMVLGWTGAAAYTAQGAAFGGSTYLSRAALTGLTTQGPWTLSFWLQMTGGDSIAQDIMSMRKTGVQQYLHLYRTGANKLEMDTWDNTAAQSTFLSSVATYVGGMTWKHFMASANASGVFKGFYVNGVLDQDAGSYGGWNTGFDQVDTVWIGGTNTAQSPLNLADFWFDNSYMDLSVTTNAQKFYNAGVVDLGANGQTPTGSSPKLFLHNPYTSWQNNLGTGGNFAVNGPALGSTTGPP